MKLIIFLLLLSINSFAADRYFVGGGSSVQWNATGNTNWSETSGGANNASVPTISDNVIFDVNSGALPVTIGVPLACLSLTITSDYTGTMTHNSTLQIAGDVTFGANYTIAGTSQITITATSTITSNGKVWPNTVTLSGAATRTLADDWTINGTLIISTATTLNGQTLTSNGLTVSAVLQGTTNLVLTGGIWSGNLSLYNNLTFAGNVTVSGFVMYRAGTLTYTSGTVTTTGSTLQTMASCTLNTAGITWNNVIFTAGTYTVTNNSLLTVTSLFYAVGSAITMAGTAGFTAHTLTFQNQTANTHTFVEGITYTITNALNSLTCPPSNKVILISSHATNKAIITLNQGATCSATASFTRIDASGGRTINSFNGVATSCLNINTYTDLKTVSNNFIN